MEINPTDFRLHLQQLQMNAPVIVAVSGGVDSMVLLHLLFRLEIPCFVAHCNFQLRGVDSDSDMQFVDNECYKYGFSCYIKKFQTVEYATSKRLSIQEAARNLRYDWFEELISETGAKHLLTAHHLDDQLETVLFHIARGTGLKGILGIPEKRGPFLRPLLRYSKEHILHYACQNNVAYREDASNSSDHYSRNYIRHHLTPAFKKMNPNWTATFARTIDQWKGSAILQDWAIKEWTHKIQESIPEGVLLIWNRNRLSNSPAPYTILADALMPLGFNSTQLNEILAHPIPSQGQQWYSKTHQVFLDGDRLVVQELSAGKKWEVLWANFECPLDFDKGTLQLYEGSLSGSNNKNLAFFNLEKIRLPLKLRSWKEGDWFYPQGMEGRKQKLKKFFNNEKVPRYLKNDVPLLVNGDGQIIWVVGYRIDDRFKVNQRTTNSIGLVYKRKFNSIGN